MLYVGLAALVAAQVLGIVGLVRPGYELLVAIAMLLLFVPPFLMAVAVFLSI